MVNVDSGTYRFGYGGTSDVYIDSDNFYWRTDNGGANQMSLISGNLLMGHTASMNSGGNTPRLQVSNNTNDAAIGVYNYGNNAAHFASLRLAHSKNGTIGSHTVLADNDKIGTIEFNGSDGTNFDTIGARIIAEVDGTPASNRMPSALTFSTAAGGSDDDVTERMRITSTGNVNIGSATSAIQATGLHIGVGAPAAMGNITIESSSNATSPPTLHFAKARGSAGSRSAINTAGGDILGSLTFTGFDGAHDRTGAEIQALSIATSSQGTDMPADLLFLTSADGTSSPATRIFNFPFLSLYLTSIPAFLIFSTRFFITLKCTLPSNLIVASVILSAEP